MSRIERAVQWWSQRNPRERAMLLLMLAALGAFGFWYGLIWPARAVRDAAQQRYDRALADLRVVQATVHALESTGPAPTHAPEVIAPALEARARESGIALSRQRRDGAGQLVVEMDAVSSRALFAWLEALRTGDGIEAARVEAERTDAQLRAKVVFPAATP